MNEQIENIFMKHDLKEGQLNYTVIRTRQRNWHILLMSWYRRVGKNHYP